LGYSFIILINILQKPTTVIAISLALVTALVAVFVVASPVFAEFQLKNELANNCANYSSSEGVERNIAIDIDNRLVHVTFANQTTVLPLSKSASVADYSGCSTETTKLLTMVQKDIDKYITESCGNFKAIINGEKPLDEKNGETANMQGAIDFVEQYCQ